VRRDEPGVRWAVEDGVAWITLARPRRGNRIDQATAQAFCDAAEEIEFDDRVAVVVVQGSGRTFSTFRGRRRTLSARSGRRRSTGRSKTFSRSSNIRDAA